MTPEVEKIVRDAIVKITLMREAQKQKAYFVLRMQDKLTAAKEAEREADMEIAEAEYALKHGVAKPVQGELAL